jgi:hypothetical protein
MSEKIYNAVMQFAKAGHKPKDIWQGEVDAADITSAEGRQEFLTATLAMVVYKWLSEQENEEWYAQFKKSEGDDPGRSENVEIKYGEEVIATFMLDFKVIDNPAPAEPLITDADVAFLNSVMEERAGELPLDQNLSAEGKKNEEGQDVC